jgi:FtsH-binding integral membrane protein
MNRTVARLIWASTLVVPISFAAVASSFRWGTVPSGSSDLFFWISVLASAFCIALARVLPQRIRHVPAGREATAFIRLVSGWALCEGAALFPLVAWIITDDPRLLGVCAVDLLALALLYPSAARWASLVPGDPTPARW